MQAEHYKRAGVDIVKNEVFVGRIKQLLAAHPQVQAPIAIGSFAGLYERENGRYLCATSDGVGTKLILAQQYAQYHHIGIDLVAMNVNDLVCCGAAPLFFLDYLAYSHLPLAAMEAIIAGIIAGCAQAGCVLLGGETAEMPGHYSAGAFDLAGFAVGEVHKRHLITGNRIRVGDSLLGLAASGFHANGFSLLRKLLEAHSDPAHVLPGLLEPTRIYVPAVLNILQEFPDQIKGMAHITGSGFHNIARINPHMGYRIEQVPAYADLPPIFAQMLAGTAIERHELYSTFNMGVGLVMVVDASVEAALSSHLREFGINSWHLGEVTKGKEREWNF